MTFEEAKKSIRWILTVSHPIGSWELENIMDALDITPCDISTCKVAKALWGNKGNLPDIDISRVKNDTPLEAQPTDKRDCKTCTHSNNGECAYTEECHECMWESKYEQQPSEDCISREQAKKFLYEEIERLHDDGLYDCFSRIIDDMYNELPSVTPTSDEIKEAYLKGYDYGVKDWFKSKTQPSEDAVSREAVLSLQTEYAEKMGATTFWKLRDDIRGLPPVTPERPKGKWVYTPKRRLIDETDEGCVYMTDYRCTCSECGGDFGFQKMSDAYCKYCGAKMEDGEK